MAAPARRGRWLWKLFAWPGIIWLALLFVFPLYVVLALAFGSLDPIFRSPVPVWNPLNWDPTQFQYVLTHIFGEDGFFGPAIVRTVVFVVIASVGCLLISYPVAYFVSRFGGRRKALLLGLLASGSALFLASGGSPKATSDRHSAPMQLTAES